MRKEFIIAIISGITIGLVVAFGIWRANYAFKSEEHVETETKTTVEQNETPAENISLTIIKPEENDVVGETPITVSGAAKPGSIVVISGEQEDHIISVSETGSFEEEVNLVSGVNEIILAHSGGENEVQTKSIRVIYSTEFEKEDPE